MYIQEPTLLMKSALVFAQIIAFYNLLIWIRIIVSWLSPTTGLKQNSFFQMLGRIVDPYLALFKNVNFLKTSSLDFTPLLAFAVLSVFQSILSLFGSTGSITLYLILAVLINTLWSYIVSPFFIILIVLILVRLFLCFKKNANTINLIRGIEKIIGGYLNWIQKIFFFSKIVADRTLLIVSAIFSILSFIFIKQIITFIISYLISL